MKFQILFFSTVFALFASSGSIYDIQVSAIDGNQVSLALYQGKKIIITAFDGAVPDVNQLVFLDSLQTANDSIVVIAVPATDFSGSKSLQELIGLRDSLNLHFLITMPSAVKKTSNTNQLQLFKFLTNANENGHFDEEVEEPDQLYFITSNGTLYSLLKKETPHNIINDVLHQQVNN